MLDANNRFETARNLDPVFGSFENFEDAPPMVPGRVIVVTDAMRAADAAMLAEREAAAVSVWPIKAELWRENLLKAKPKPRTLLPPRKRAPVAGKSNCDCGAELRSDNVTGICKKCRQRPELEPLRSCANGCGTKLQRTNADDFCGQCKFLRDRHAKVVAQQAECASGCGRKLRNGAPRRPDNLCTECGRRADRTAGKRTAAAAAKRSDLEKLRMENQMKREAEKKQCAVASCDIMTNAASGRCGKHWAPRKGTAMRDGSVWGGLPKKAAAPKKPRIGSDEAG